MGSDRVEPEPVAVRQRLLLRRTPVLVALVSVVVVYGCVVAGLGAASGHQAPGSGLPRFVRSLPGQVVSLNPQGTMTIGPPDNEQPQALPTLGSFRDRGVAASPDGLWLVDSVGQMIDATGARLAVAPSIALMTMGTVAIPGSFTDGDRGVVVVAPATTGTSTAVFVVLVSGALSELGTGDYVSGDPKALGAFVSALSPVQPSTAPPGGLAGQADSAVELNDLGTPATVLATARQLEGLVGAHPTVGAHLESYPNPTGSEVAVVLDPLGAGDSNAAVVVLDRHGRVLGKVLAGAGPTEYVPPSWSPDGRSLAWTTSGPSGTEVAVWKVGGDFTLTLAPDAGDDGLGCLWSPDGTSLLCSMSTGAPQPAFWLFATTGGGPQYLVNSDGNTPVAWLAAPRDRERHGQLTVSTR